MNQTINQTQVQSGAKLNFFARTLLWFGLGLIITFAITFGLPALLSLGLSWDQFETALYVMCGIGAVGVLIFSLVVMFKSFSARGLGIVTYILYTIFMGMALTPLYILGADPVGMLAIVYALGITGGIFVIMGFIGVLSGGRIKGMWLLAMGLAVGSIILTLINFFVFNETIYWIISFAMLFVFVLYVGIDFAIISRHPENASNSLAILCAFNLYTDFIVIFIRILPFVLKGLSKR